ncbi:DUF5805 domain-containing protein [Halobaculum litoreum]|uniref:DUF5805 domain-containing protein n=1 Tax=Halobaculum litoreum TaxID=3031998 RepID=A0ABD5XPP8_9EURY
MSEADADTERVAVTARVPAYQKEAWVAEADRLGMSQSEFVRTMVQAGRRDLGIADGRAAPGRRGVDGRRPRGSGNDCRGTGGCFSPSNPGGDGLETPLLAALDREGVMSFDELVEAVAGDVEERVDETMGALQSRGLVRYSGRDGGYVRVDR